MNSLVNSLDSSDALSQSPSKLAERRWSVQVENTTTDKATDCQATNRIQLTVVIPVYNEPDTIHHVVESVMALPITKQIVVIDDGSTDETKSIVQELERTFGVAAVYHKTNRGKGAAIQSGFALAEGDIVIVQDADLEYTPLDILDVISPIQANVADVVYGSRYLKMETGSDSSVHRFGNRMLTLLSNIASGQRLTDMETCYKAFRRETLQSIHIEQQRFGFEPEITAKLAKRGIKIHEVPIHYKARSWSEGKKIGVTDLFNALWCIARYRFFD